MITNLPLLFVNGHPTSLERMSVLEMESFVPFMVRCSRADRERPPWWPDDVRYAPGPRPPRRPDGCARADWARRLRRLVQRCYNHHKGSFLLDFCARISQDGVADLAYVSNEDGTTSLYLKQPQRRLLVTFRNENMLYDRRPPAPAARRPRGRPRLLPPAKGAPAPPAPPADEIYLCDTCDETFDGLEALREHERRRERDEPPEAGEQPEVGAEPLDLNAFARALGLAPSGPAADATGRAGRAVAPLSAGRERRSVLHDGLAHFPFSSPAGRRALALARKPAFDAARHRDGHEKYCATRSTRVPPRQFPVRHRRDGRGRERPLFAHRRKLVLDLDAQLKYLACRPCSVKVERLPPEMIAGRVVLHDDDVQFVSHTRLEPEPEPSSSRVEPEPSSSKRPGDVLVIDLCSDDDDAKDHDENLRPSSAPRANHPPLDRNRNKAPSLHGANARETVSHATLRPLQQCQVLLHKFNAAVISID